MTLTEFLLARIEEDEAAAHSASPGGWHYGGVDSVAGGTLYDRSRTIASLIYEQRGDHDGRIVRHLLAPEADANGTHIARWDPARVLAECEAKRRIVEYHALDEHEQYGPCCSCCEGGSGAGAPWPCQTLRALALPYVDHPDYDESWRL